MIRPGPLLLLCLLSPGSARASLPDLAGLGTRGPALAGTGAAYLGGFEATYANPAGIVDAGRRLVLGVIYGGYRLSLDGSPHPVDGTSGLLLGASLPLPLGGAMRDRIALGMGFYLPFGVINRARDPFPTQPRAALLDVRTQVVSVLLGAGVRLPAGVSVGGGVLALAALVGEIHIAPDGLGRITAASQEQLTVDYAPVVGARYAPLGGRLSLGTVFRGASRSGYDLVIKSQLGDAVPVELPDIRIAGVAQFDPLQLAFEVAVRPSAVLLLCVQVAWKRWSAYDNPVLPATAGAEPLPRTAFRDTAVPRVALEWLPPGAGGRTAIRLGYFFELSPAPRGERTRVLLDASRHVMSFGLGHRLPGRLPLVMDAFVQWHELAYSERLSGGFALGGASLGVDL